MDNKIFNLDRKINSLVEQMPGQPEQSKAFVLTLTGGGYGTEHEPYQTQSVQDFNLDVGKLNITITISSNFTIPGDRDLRIDIYKGGLGGKLAKTYWTNIM